MTGVDSGAWAALAGPRPNATFRPFSPTERRGRLT